MPIDITDVSVFTDPVTAPAGADPANAASVVDPVQKLANRTRYLYDKFEAVTGHVVLPSPLQYTKRLTAALFVPASGTWTRPDVGQVLGGSIAATGFWDITDLVPYNGSIVRVRVLVDPELARAVLDGRVIANLVSRTYGASYVLPAIDAPTTEATNDDDGTASLQWIVVTPASPVAVAGKTWAVQVQTGGTGTGADKFYAVVVEYSVPMITGE